MSNYPLPSFSTDGKLILRPSLLSISLKIHSQSSQAVLTDKSSVGQYQDNLMEASIWPSWISIRISGSSLLIGLRSSWIRWILSLKLLSCLIIIIQSKKHKRKRIKSSLIILLISTSMAIILLPSSILNIKIFYKHLKIIQSLNSSRIGKLMIIKLLLLLKRISSTGRKSKRKTRSSWKALRNH